MTCRNSWLHTQRILSPWLPTRASHEHPIYILDQLRYGAVYRASINGQQSMFESHLEGRRISNVYLQPLSSIQ